MHVVVYNVISLKQTNKQTNKTQTNKQNPNKHTQVIGSLKKNTKIIKRIIDISLNVTCMDHQINGNK